MNESTRQSGHCVDDEKEQRAYRGRCDPVRPSRPHHRGHAARQIVARHGGEDMEGAGFHDGWFPSV